MLLAMLDRKQLALAHKASSADPQQGGGHAYPAVAHTMVGLRRLDHVQSCIESLLEEGVRGDFIETGVWRGGVTIFMRGVLEAYGVRDRTVWVADSFKGLPPPDAARYPADAGDIQHEIDVLSVTVEEVRANFATYGLLDDQVRFLPGWFEETLPKAPIERLALLRLDGDMYQSTWDVLSNLYPRVAPGGYVIVDDYALPGCRQAVQDYREHARLDIEIEPIAGSRYGVAWRVRNG
jgi:O-methyltransferase